MASPADLLERCGRIMVMLWRENLLTFAKVNARSYDYKSGERRLRKLEKVLRQVSRPGLVFCGSVLG